MDKATKKRIKKYAAWISLAALVALLAVMPLLAQSEAEEDGPVASVLSAPVQKASVESVLHGGGILTAGNAMDITIPSTVKINAFLVKNGDQVTKGTPVAEVDKVSLMNAIVSVQDTMDILQKQINSAGDDTVSSTISATAGGHIKEIYAQIGDSVQDVMIRHGALAVLSLDGRMAVTIQRDMLLAAGDTAWITFPDGTQVAGRVESGLDGKVTVSMEDNDYAIGEAVTVTTDDGELIGSGELHVHNAWKATAFTGTVSAVYARENTDVYAGSTLFTLKDTDFSGNMESLANLHREYEELLQDLFRMYDSGYITAPCDGVVSGVDKNSTHLLAAAAEESWTVQLLSSTTPCTQNPEKGMCAASKHLEGCYYFCTGTSSCTALEHEPDCYFYCSRTDDCDAPVHKVGCPHYCTNASGCPGKFHKDSCPEKCTNTKDCLASLGNHQQSCPQRCTNTAGCSANNHEETCPEKCTNDASCKVTIFKNHEETCPERCQNITGCIAQDDHLDTCPELPHEEYTGYVGVVNTVDEANKALSLSIVNTPGKVVYTNKWDYGTLDVKKASGAVPDKNNVYFYQTGSYKKGDIVVVAYKDDGTYVISNTGNSTNSGSGGMGGFAGFGGFSFSFGGFGATGAGAAQELFPLDGDVLMTVTEQDTMTLTINLDEHDIAKVSLGQPAVVEVAAIKGQTFDAEITDIGTFGTSSGGSSKFTVELTMALSENMLAGMNATAVIPLYTKMDVLTIPAAALVETENGTCVYTALDPDSGEPTSAVMVTTGISDGLIVEILSGLNPGDTVYYSYYDVLELDHTAKQEYSFR